MSDLDFAANIERFSGFASVYDTCRPSPPEALSEIICHFAGLARLSLVVDLGSGTGLSTRYWSAKAERVIGIEPAETMRNHSQSLGGVNITYRQGFSHDTGLPSHCAELVTCSQSLHWMDPEPTFKEVARILKPGGVFAAVDYDWPPLTGVWLVDAAFEACMAQTRILERYHRVSEKVHQWDKENHLERIKGSAKFRYAREVLLHFSDLGNAERIVGLLLSQGHIQTLLKNQVTERNLGIQGFRQIAKEQLGPEPRRFYWCCRVRLGVV
jgi:SAM-dependent methyltransferase